MCVIRANTIQTKPIKETPTLSPEELLKEKFNYLKKLVAKS